MAQILARLGKTARKRPHADARMVLALDERNAQTQTVLRTFRLDKAGECFLRTVMNTDGRITGYRLISNAKVAAQYELPPEHADAFKQILYKETHKNAAGHIAECCAMYLQHHTPQQLIALAEKHSLIEKHTAETD